jgi:hypothetical protein
LIETVRAVRDETHKGFFDISIDIDSREPFVSEIWSNVQVDRSDHFHVRCRRGVSISCELERMEEGRTHIVAIFGRSRELDS